MHQSKLIEALRTLSGKQLSRFSDFISSPLFNKNKDIELFFNYLQKFYPDFTHINLSKEVVLKELKTITDTDEKRLANLMNGTLKLLENYLSWEAIENQPLTGWLLLTEHYHQHELPRHYNSVVSKAEKWLGQYPFRDADYFLNSYLLQRRHYEDSDATRRDYNKELQHAADALDYFYLLEKLRYACEMLNFEHTLNIRYQLNFIHEINASLNGHEFSEMPAISVYYKLLKMLSNLELTDPYFQVKNLLVRHDKIFSQRECKHLYDILLNFCTWRVTRYHDSFFEQEYFHLNKELLEKGLLFENKELSPWRFSNLVTVGLRLGENQWTYRFIYEFRKFLPAEHAENLFYYKLGQYFYHTGRLAEAQDSLNKVELKDPFLALSVKNLLARIYFETGENELLLSFLEAYRIYLLRDKLTKPEMKKQVRHFIDALRKLARTPHFDKTKLAALRENLPSANEMIHKEWIIEKIDNVFTK